MKNDDIKKFLVQSLNMALKINGETSYTNSFDIKVKHEGFFFIPRVPCGYVINHDLYVQIFTIASAVLYPRFTLLKQSGTYFVPMQTDDIHIERALFFPWVLGIPERLVIGDLREFLKVVPSDTIPIMKNLNINLNKMTSMAIAGNSGSGKSYFLTYVLYVLKSTSKLIIVDPKFDLPSRWAKKNNVRLVSPTMNRSKNDFVSEVNDVLSECLNLIYHRQQILFENPDTKFEHYTVVIDELLSLSTDVNKAIKESFFGLLSQISLLGRATKIHLVLVSQRFEANALPVACREQMNVLVQIGNINSRTTQFLFPDLDVDGIVIPSGIGTGLIQIIDNEHPFQVLPLLTPTFNEKGTTSR